MNRGNIIREMSSYFGGQKEAADALDFVLETLIRAVVEDGKAQVTGFGTLKKVTRGSHWARNPQTGEQVEVADQEVVKFLPGALFRDLVNGRRELPEDGRIQLKAHKSN